MKKRLREQREAPVCLQEPLSSASVLLPSRSNFIRHTSSSSWELTHSLLFILALLPLPQLSPLSSLSVLSSLGSVSRNHSDAADHQKVEREAAVRLRAGLHKCGLSQVLPHFPHIGQRARPVTRVCLHVGLMPEYLSHSPSLQKEESHISS